MIKLPVELHYTLNISAVQISHRQVGHGYTKGKGERHHNGIIFPKDGR